MNQSKLGSVRKKITDIYRKKEYLFIWIISVALIGGIIFCTGGIFDGWHRIDDHESYRILKLYKEQHVPWTEPFLRFLRDDVKRRWRPLYWFFRAAMPYLFGDHPAIYRLIFCASGILTYVYLYRSVRNLKCSVGFSHLFVLLVLMGRQFEVWYRIGNQENLGMLFFAVCLYLLTTQYKDNLFKRSTDIWIVVMAFCSGLMKESFLLLIPAIVWLRLGLEAVRNLRSPRDILKIFLKNILFIIILAVFFLLNVYIIVTYVGVNRIGYAGLDESYGIKEYIWALQRLCRDSLHSYVILACVILSITLINLCILFITKRLNFDMNVILLLVLLIFGGYVVLTQMVLHAKSGMWTRYLLPATVGFAVIFIVCTDLLLKNAWYKIMIGLTTAAFLVGRFKLSIVNMSYHYAWETKAINQVYDIVLDRTETNSQIVNAFSNEESDISFGIFMELQGRPYVYRYDFEDKLTTDVFGENMGESIQLDKADVFVSWMEDEESDALIKSYGDWDKVNVMGMYNIYVRK